MAGELKKKPYAAYRNIIYPALLIFLLFYLIPAGIVAIQNFFKLVVFGGWRISEFGKKIELFSLRPVNIFYQELWSWFKCLSQGICPLYKK
jgi:hypothetical protein